MKNERRGTPCTDHLGNTFPSENAMCRAHGVNPKSYRRKVRTGAGLEQALSAGTRHNSKPCTDHLGQGFDSESAMCDAHGISVKTYRRRLRNGASVRQALSGVRFDPSKKPYAGKACEDHLGNRYASISAMCAAHGITYQCYKKRLAEGMSREDALTTPKRQSKPAKTPDGTACASMREMFGKIGLKEATYHGRIKSGKSGTELLMPAFHGNPCTDHRGARHPSLKAMCAAYGINIGTYRSRLRSGWTMEKALETPAKNVKALIRDPETGAMATTADTAARWHVSLSALRNHRDACQDWDRALEATCAFQWRGTRAGTTQVLGCIRWPWFLCRDGNGSDLLLHAFRLRDMKDAGQAAI